MVLINLQKISKIYAKGKPNEFRALDGINLEIKKGEFVAIMGVSGSGKSTLMNIIGCLDKPTSGHYLLEGAEVTSKKSSDLVRVRRDKIGFIFQNFNLLPRRSALTNVELPLIYKSFRPKVRRAKALESLRRVALDNKSKHKSSMLSGGEQQRVAIARALVNDPVVILADEPTGNLDSKSGFQVMDLLARFNKNGATIVVVTHDPEIAEYAQRTINLHDGKIVD
jgi:putative ABC transport system ATP-binding protein